MKYPIGFTIYPIDYTKHWIEVYQIFEYENGNTCKLRVYLEKQPNDDSFVILTIPAGETLLTALLESGNYLESK